jgi:hypothetical protein
LCARPNERFVPTRLLSIGSISGVSTIKLCDPVDSTEAVKWAALSHCWGGGHPLSLTTSTIEQRKSGINIDELPATFQDAIQVARHLKILAAVMEASCLTRGRNPYGEVSGGRIVLRGRLAPVMISPPSTNADYEIYYHSENDKMSSKAWCNSDGRLAEYEFLTSSGHKEKSLRRARLGDAFPASDMPASFFCVAETGCANF